MKYTLVFITLIVTCNAALAQRRDNTTNTTDPRIKAMQEKNGSVEIGSPLQAAFYFNRAIKSEANKDSLGIVLNLFQKIYYYDSSSHLAIYASHFLDSVQDNRKTQITQQLLGNWRWVESPSNWAASYTPAICNCEKEIVFDTQEIHFIENGKEVVAYKYTLVRYHDLVNWVDRKPRWSFYYLVDVQGLNEKWNVHFLSPRPANTTSDFFGRKNESILINRKYNCACGCPEDLYEKVVHY